MVKPKNAHIDSKSLVPSCWLFIPFPETDLLSVVSGVYIKNNCSYI